jgi:hypothetical protein
MRPLQPDNPATLGAAPGSLPELGKATQRPPQTTTPAHGSQKPSGKAGNAAAAGNGQEQSVIPAGFLETLNPGGR